MEHVFKVGDRVRHPRYGSGVVYATLCRVLFDCREDAHVAVDSLTPIPPEPEFIDATEEHVGMDMVCRVRDYDSQAWIPGLTLCGIVNTKSWKWYSVGDYSKSTDPHPCHYRCCQVGNPKYKPAG